MPPGPGGVGACGGSAGDSSRGPLRLLRGRELVPGDLAGPQVLADLLGEPLGLAPVHHRSDGRADHERGEVGQVAEGALDDALPQLALDGPGQGRVETGGLDDVDAPLLGPRREVGGAALGQGAGRAHAVDPVQLGDELKLDGDHADDLGGQLGGHGGRNGQHNRGAHARAHGRGGAHGARDELVRNLVGAEPRELRSQRREVPHRNTGRARDDPVGDLAMIRLATAVAPARTPRPVRLIPLPAALVPRPTASASEAARPRSTFASSRWKRPAP